MIALYIVAWLALFIISVGFIIAWAVWLRRLLLVGMVTVGTAHFTIMGIVFLVGFENYINKGAYWTGWLLCHIGEPL